MTAVFKLVPTTQKYDWGKIGLSSKVAQYAAAGKLPGFTLDEKAPYAEVSNVSASTGVEVASLAPGTYPAGIMRLSEGIRQWTCFRGEGGVLAIPSSTDTSDNTAVDAQPDHTLLWIILVLTAQTALF